MRFLTALVGLLLLAALPAVAVAKKRGPSPRAVVLTGKLAPAEAPPAAVARDDDDDEDDDDRKGRGRDRGEEGEGERHEAETPEAQDDVDAGDETDADEAEIEALEDEVEPVTGTLRLVDTKRRDVLQVRAEHLVPGERYAVALRRGAGCGSPSDPALPGFGAGALVADEDGKARLTTRSRSYAARAGVTDFVTVSDAEGTLVACGELTPKRARR